ncbi:MULTISPECIES: Spo0B C-terminal domain-containing protein [unclassified Bacillus cereus group]|uniref:Spo0B C-terminal domain-containing protein n=1 Tax=unclassified Bacillus cereus group TaxID=2750818 RepID=UPI001F577435|nr:MULTISPECIES: Spo0B C-terminal domain-containing protein [unclassified Bacillus cereus group]
MKEKWTIIDALRHARHDWLNRMQMIKGNLSLGRVEEIHRLIDHFVQEARQESNLIGLSMLSFSEWILTYNWKQQPCLLEYEVLGELHNLSHLDEVVCIWTEEFFSMLQHSLDVYVENYVCITIECDAENARFFFDFRGKLTNVEKLQTWLANKKSEWCSISYTVRDDEVSVILQPIEKSVVK